MKNWLPKKWRFWTVVLEKTLESPLDCKEIQSAHPKGNQSWIFIGRADAEAEAPILWPPDTKSWLTGKDPDAGKDWRQEERGWQDEIVGWHHQLDGHAFKHAPGVGDGPGSLAYCSPWGRRVRHDRVTALTDCNEARMSTLKFWSSRENLFRFTIPFPSLINHFSLIKWVQVNSSVFWEALMYFLGWANSKQLLMFIIKTHVTLKSFL